MDKRSPRGFVLVVVMLVAIAAAVIAGGLAARGEDARLRAVHVEHADLAEGLAQAGMQRAKGYAETIARNFGDFDRLLDPGLNASCSGLPGSAPTCTTCNRPDFGDGTDAVYNGKTYKRVAYGEGAYLVRFDDDQDDQQVVLGWTRNTGNNIAAVNCIEGPGVLSGVDNPVRDRNRAVWITVIGISPGVDPDRAQHRVVLRTLYTNTNPATIAGITVDGNISVGGSAELFACSPIGSLEVNGTLSGPGGGGGACACGDSLADSLGGWDHCTDPTYAGACTAVGCAPGALGTPGPSNPLVDAVDSAAGKNLYFDWTKPCTFYVDEAATFTGKSLWVWDATANRGPGGALCSDFDGAALTINAAMPPDPDDDSYRRCWTPLLLDLGGACTSPWGENAAGCEWAPNGATSPSIGTAAMNAFMGATPFGGANLPGGATYNKPAWTAACQVTYPGLPAASCTTCNGAVGVMQEHPGPKPYWFKGDSLAEIRAIPAGVYFYNTSVDLGSLDFSAPYPSTLPPIDITQWPLVTIATTGTVEGSGTVFLGTGLDKPTSRYPSVVSNGDFDFSGGGDKALAGSIYSQGNLNWNGNVTMHLFGELHINGSWNIGGNGAYHWRYTSAFNATAAAGSRSLPLLSPSYE